MFYVSSIITLLLSFVQSIRFIVYNFNSCFVFLSFHVSLFCFGIVLVAAHGLQSAMEYNLN